MSEGNRKYIRSMFIDEGVVVDKDIEEEYLVLCSKLLGDDEEYVGKTNMTLAEISRFEELSPLFISNGEIEEIDLEIFKAFLPFSLTMLGFALGYLYYIMA